MGVGAPSGTVTFLFTDIEGSTRLWQRNETAMRSALERHDAILQSTIDSHGGYVFSTGGDGFGVAFARAGDAVAAAVDVQTGLAAERWPEGTPIRVRMALHTGEVTERGGDYFGTPVNQAARLMAVGHGGQVLCSAVTAGLLQGEVPLVDLGEHRLKDLSAPQRVFQVGEGLFAPLRSVGAVPGNLPTMLTELIGRTEDIADLSALLDRERLVTLTGVGGVGKTSMALAVAARSTGAFPDGCWFAELAPAATADDVVRAVAAAMGAPVTDLPGLSRFLSDRRVLIVLDNCEHVLSDAAALAENVLGTGPEVAIIATSREPLGARGEVVRGVRSLTVPGPDTSAAAAAAASAVSLFVARASAASERFGLDESNVEAVVEICRQLDGIPLAIELAAARVRGMGPAEIARRLSERFRLLTAGRGALERHRTLLGAVSWSHDLLTDEERRVFRRLAVFPASFDLAAAEAVGGADDPVDVVDCVLRLVDRSLVVYDPAADRYRLLETLRQYAADHLADAGEADLTRDHHADFYRTLASRSASEGEVPSAATITRLWTEVDNVRAVADWLEQQGRWGDALELCRHLFLFMVLHTPLDGLRLYHSAIEHLPDLHVQDRIDALGELDEFKVISGQPLEDVLVGTSIALADATGLRQSPSAWLARAIALIRTPGLEEARLAAEAALAAAEERGLQHAATSALGVLACVLARLGDLGRSDEVAAETMRRARLLAHPSPLSVAVNAAAACYLTYRDPPEFEAGLRVLEANPFRPESVSPGSTVVLHRMWGLAHLGLGRPDLAVAHLTTSLRVADQSGLRGLIDDGPIALAVALAETGRPRLAAQVDSYANTNFPRHAIQYASYVWLQARLAAAKDAVGVTEWTAAAEAGAHLDRRGFMRLLAVAEDSIEVGAEPS